MTQPFNRQWTRWLGRTSRKYVAPDGEVITATRHHTLPVDGIAVWKSKGEVGKQAGLITFWERQPDTTVKQLEDEYFDWVDERRPVRHGNS